jgi:hypothetical protein
MERRDSWGVGEPDGRHWKKLYVLPTLEIDLMTLSYWSDSFGDIVWEESQLVSQGFPPINVTDVPSCGIGIPGLPLCNREGENLPS